MADLLAGALSEEQFARFVDALVADPQEHASLADLLREDHPWYHERSAAAITRMRGWVLLALARTRVSGRELPFLLEELDAGMDAYLVAAAARALSAYEFPNAALVPFVMRALSNFRDEPLSFATYGEYATSSAETSPVRELLGVLAWLGPYAKSALPELRSMKAHPGRLSQKMIAELDRAVSAIEDRTAGRRRDVSDCCSLPIPFGQQWWAPFRRNIIDSVDGVLFEDQAAELTRFRGFFSGRPSIVVFFYTRCDNPWKCSLTVTKLGRVQRLLEERGLADQIQTAAITYDSFFDTPERLHAYGKDRGLRFDRRHRMFRTRDGFEFLSSDLNLGVNFLDSTVSRHRIELYVLDGGGRIAASFHRIHWKETEVVDRAQEVLAEGSRPSVPMGASSRAPGSAVVSVFGTLASLAWAFFPKCPMCWAAYLSAFGLVGIAPSPHFAEMQPLLMGMILINLMSVWIRARATHRRSGLCLVVLGTLGIILTKLLPGWNSLAPWGVGISFVGSLWNAVNRADLDFCLRRILARAPDRAVS
jgi:protein SCO1/2